MNQGHYKVWISPLRATIEGTTLHLEAPNDFVANSVRNRLQDTIEDASKAVLGPSATVVIEVASGRAASMSRTPSKASLPTRNQAVQASLLPMVEPSMAPCATLSSTGLIPTAQAPSKQPSETRRASGQRTRSTRRNTAQEARPSLITGLAPREVQIVSAQKATQASLMVSNGDNVPQAYTPQSTRHQASMNQSNHAEQMALPLDWAPSHQAQNWRFSFDEFIVGSNNELAFAAARGMCRSTAAVDTLFLNSHTGLGKTHLMHAVGQSLCKACNRVNPRIEYLTAEEFASRMVLAMRAYDMERFKARYRDVDVLLLEDVHFLQGKEKMQGEVLATIKSLQERGSRVVFSSTFAPRELSNVDSQLVSRFGSGFLAGIERPDFDTRRRIVEAKARIHQVNLPDAVTDLVAERINDDIRQIESCLRNLILKAQVLNQRISLDMALDMIGNFASTASVIDIETILRMICEGFGLSVDQLNSRSRKREYVTARNAAYLLARKHTDLSLKEIGDKFNRRHSTVLKGITALEREITRETPLGRQVANTLSMLERNSHMRL